MDLTQTGLKVANYKSFGSDPVGFDEIKSFNIIVGRNNTGKSALLDLLSLTTNNWTVDQAQYHRKKQSDVFVSQILDEPFLRAIFPQNSRGGPIGQGISSYWEVGKLLIGCRIILHVQNRELWASDIDLPSIPPLLAPHLGNNPKHTILSVFNAQRGRLTNPFKTMMVRRLTADRDMPPEEYNEIVMMNEGGLGATNIITQFLTRTKYDGDIVRVTLRDALNAIFAPDALFTEILSKQNEHSKWEVFLAEAGSGTVALAHSGSGLKTVLLILICFHIVPLIDGRGLSNYLFCFEEPENNLHPALQRRLLTYICAFGRKR